MEGPSQRVFLVGGERIMMKLWKKVAQYPRLGLILLAFIAFVALGLPDGLLGVGWPSIRANFSIPLDAIGVFLIAAVAGYMTSSFLSGYLLVRAGVGRILAASCFLTGLSLIGYTLVPEWWMMVTLAVFAGLGAGAIDAGLNTYVASHFGEGLMQWLHASWGVGITIGPILMTLGLTAMNSWRFGYQVVGGFQIALAVGFVLTLAMWSQHQAPSGAGVEKKLTDYKTPMGETLRQPQVWLSVLLFFFYVGGETSLGTWTYTLLTESRGVDVTVAGFFAGSYWFTFTIGRILAGLVARRVGVNRLIMGGLAGALLGTLLLIWNPSQMAMRVGDHFAANTIGMQMAATGLGMAVIPGLMGVLARQISLEVIPIVLLSVYVGLLGVYLLTLRLRRVQPAPVFVPAGSDETGGR